MATWFAVRQISFRVKRVDGKIVQEKVDIADPAKSLKDLEEKVGVVCPEDRRKELFDGLQEGGAHWLDSINVPEWYTTANKEDISNALRWGYEMVLAQHHLGETKLHEQANLTWKKEADKIRAELDQVKKDADRRIEQTKKDAESLLIVKEKEAQSWQQSALANLSASGIESKLEKVKKEMAEEQRIVLSAVERERLTLKEQIEQLQTQNAKLEQSRDMLQTKLDHKSNHDALMNKSVHKGNEGENLVDSWLRTAFYGGEIERVSKEADKMDHHVTWEGIKFMVDTKNHNGALHSIKDVKKFHDNLQADPEIQVGILLCTHVHVPNHNRFWVETEFVNEKLVIYMNRVSENPIERLQLVASTLIHPFNEYLNRQRQLRELADGDDLKIWNDTAKGVLTRGWTLMLRLVGQWNTTQSAVISSMNTFQSDITAMSDDLCGELNSLGIESETPKTSGKKKSRSKKQNP
jgi:hypothetical protein